MSMTTSSVTPAVEPKQPAHRAGEASTIRRKWHAAADTGFVAVPNVLLTYFTRLKVSPTEFLVLLNLMAHWWSAEARPFPRVATIARRMDASPRTVQRALNRLRALGLIDWQRVQVKNGKIIANPNDGIRRRLYDLAPLVKVADRLAVQRLEFLADRTDRGAPQPVRDVAQAG